MTELGPCITELFIDGRYAPAVDGATFTSLDPATGTPIAEVSLAGCDDVDLAVVAARRALDGPWAAMSLTDRAAISLRIADLVQERADRFGLLDSYDAGMPIADAAGAGAAVAERFRRWAYRSREVMRSPVVPASPGVWNLSLRAPVGVVAIIVPWNYPFELLGQTVPLVLAAGNTVVFKPAEETSLSALAFGEICQEAGVPPGVINVVAGPGPRTGAHLVEHEGVDAVHFTGSVETGRIVGEVAGRALKPAILELGGKSPTIVFDDADLERACACALFSCTTNQGQLCTAGSRLLVQASVHDEVVSAVASAARRLRVGDPRDPDTQLGAIVSSAQLERIERYVDEGRAAQAHIVTGGSRPDMPAPFDGGTFYSPTVFTDVRRSASIAREEIFGPILSVLSFEDEPGAVELANDVAYGLSASVWTTDVDRAVRVASSLSVGEVFVNTVLGPNEAPNEPWGVSGRGVNGPSIESARQLTRFKSVTLDATGGGPAW